MNDKTSLTLPLVFEKRQHERCRPDQVGATNSDNQTTNTTSFLKTCFNGLNALSGVGILSVPYALSSGGWLSLILLFVIAAAAFYSGLLIQRCMDEDSTIRTYPDIDNLSLLSYVSASGVFASAIILGSIFWTGAFDGIGFHQEGSVPLNWNGIPTSVSLYAFCYCAHPVFPSLYTSIKNKRQFSNVLLLCFILCTIGYASMAVLGYLMFGSTVQSQITLNLPTEKLS
ncbi:hypothetical protein Pyn_17670 [Prunus yedoensis var. nudiflora]|uniref:Amino acid transporter transmembrane domain-containing protein n=1 Tax=Prunus yedoensis var. nudiflora TaxID=2094558 RepID=A0A314V2A8_PRUYE|nr:hypothetical protein Pyn_17670 [Prunus yedoensis var. nudiflora]